LCANVLIWQKMECGVRCWYFRENIWQILKCGVDSKS
jgi:hypothetical protein